MLQGLTAGIAGGLLAPGLGPLGGVARASTPTPGPPRLVVVFTPNGTIPEEFFPFFPDRAVPLPTILSPLERHRADVLVCDRLDNNVAGSSRGNPHEKGLMTLLSGAPTILHAPADADCSSGCSVGPSAESIDQRIARQLLGVTPLPSLELAVGLEGGPHRSRMSFSGPEAPLVPLDDPAAAFERVFPQEIAGPPWAADELELRLDRLADRAGEGARRKLEAHFDAIDAVRQRLDRPPVTTDLPRPPAQTFVYPEAAQLQLDLISAALSVDATRVITLLFSGANAKLRLPWVDSPTPMTRGFHEYTHTPYRDMQDPAQVVVRDNLLAIYTWYAERVAGLADRLAAVEQADGSRLLDDTMILWCSEVSAPDAHRLSRIPFVLIGGRRWLRTGRTVDLGGEHHTALLATLLAAMGDPSPRVGQGQYDRGPIADLLQPGVLS